MTDPKDLKLDVVVKELAEENVAYVRNIGPYGGDQELFAKLFGKIMGWAGPKGLIRFPETKCISVYYDDPETTDPNKLKLDVCMTVPEDTKGSDGVEIMKTPGGLYAVGTFEIDPEDYGSAWSAIYKVWLPESGYLPEDRPNFEHYLNNPEEHPQKKHIIEICIPVKKA